MYPRVLYDTLFGFVPGLRQLAEALGGVKGTMGNCEALMSKVSTSIAVIHAYTLRYVTFVPQRTTTVGRQDDFVFVCVCECLPHFLVFQRGGAKNCVLQLVAGSFFFLGHARVREKETTFSIPRFFFRGGTPVSGEWIAVQRGRPAG